MPFGHNEKMKIPSLYSLDPIFQIGLLSIEAVFPPQNLGFL